MITEVEVLRHFDDVVFLLWVLEYKVGIADHNNMEIPTHWRRLSRILISTRA
jgi:hypothetical protein